jgi:acyl CoA:acetate/3-ketoacid CoA transferase beta subunit
MRSVWTEDNSEKAMSEYTPREMMAIAAARQIRDGDIVFCGTGISMLAAMAAKHISAPQSVLFFETGAIDSVLEEIPLTVADSRATEVAPPSDHELRILREVCDPQRLILGAG